MSNFERLRDSKFFLQAIQNPADVVVGEDNVEILLEKGRIIGNKRLDHWNNEVRLVTIDSSSPQRPNLQGIYKPGSGESDLSEWDSWNGRSEIPESDHKLYRRERAAFLICQALGLSLVPTTVIREINGRSGSIQEFIPDASHVNEYSPDGLEEQLYILAIFDYMIWNKDRRNNALVQDNIVYAIDNGLSIDHWRGGWIGHYLNQYVSQYRGQVPQALITGLNAFADNSQAQEELRSALIELEFPTRSIDALFARINLITQKLSQGKLRVRDLTAFGDDNSDYLNYHPGLEEQTDLE